MHPQRSETTFPVAIIVFYQKLGGLLWPPETGHVPLIGPTCLSGRAPAAPRRRRRGPLEPAASSDTLISRPNGSRTRTAAVACPVGFAAGGESIRCPRGGRPAQIGSEILDYEQLTLFAAPQNRPRPQEMLVKFSIIC